MKFFLQDDISGRVDEIMKRLNKLMDGDVSSQMKERGVDYRVNYGASFVWLRSMAQKYGQDTELASRLWYREIRETMILATLIADATTISKNVLEDWSSLLKHNEMAEQLGANLLWRLDFLDDLAGAWLTEDDKFKQAAVWVGLAVFMQRGGSVTEQRLVEYMQIIEESFDSRDKFLQRVQGRFLRQWCRKSAEDLNKMQDFLYKISDCPNCAWLVEDLKTEIEFVKNR